ncbi:MAG: DUF5675 family protein [Bacteroidales bacterium]|nr:DUF5675 family protein [Bacteroidales bacterium]
MRIKIRRIALKPTYTIGKLYIDGIYFCDTLEDKVRDLNKNGVFDAGEVKVPGKTAIPYGKYNLTMAVQSPRFANSKTYEKCKGYLPRLLKVNAFEGILIHIGNTEADTDGCILVGENKAVGKVLNSTATFWRLYSILREAYNTGEGIIVEII